MYQPGALTVLCMCAYCPMRAGSQALMVVHVRLCELLVVTATSKLGSVASDV